MNSSFDPLERQVHRVLRSLPDQTAPSALEARVMAAVAERSARPWWQRSYSGWPAAARVAFFVFAALAAAAVIIGLSRLAGLAQVQSNLSSWRLVYDSLLGATTAVIAAIPRIYLYGLAAVLGACYLTLMGVGAAYRTLFVRS